MSAAHVNFACLSDDDDEEKEEEALNTRAQGYYTAHITEQEEGSLYVCIISVCWRIYIHIIDLEDTINQFTLCVYTQKLLMRGRKACKCCLSYKYIFTKTIKIVVIYN